MQTTSFSDALSFQNDLDKFCGWAREWLLCYNTAKHKHLKYDSYYNVSPYGYYMNDERSNIKFSVVCSYHHAEKDLGVWIASKPDFALQCDKAAIPWANKEDLHPPD